MPAKLATFSGCSFVPVTNSPDWQCIVNCAIKLMHPYDRPLKPSFAIFDTSSYLNDSRNEMNTCDNRYKACDATDRYIKKFAYRWGSISIVRRFYQFRESSNPCFKKFANRLATLNTAMIKSVNRQIDALRNSRITSRAIIMLWSSRRIVKSMH